MQLLKDLNYDLITAKLKKTIDFYDPFMDNKLNDQKIKNLTEDLDGKLATLDNKKINKLIFHICSDASHVDFKSEPQIIEIMYFERFSNDFFEMYRCVDLYEQKLIIELWLYYFYQELKSTIPEVADKSYSQYDL
jgi:hypothetical protein